MRGGVHDGIGFSVALALATIAGIGTARIVKRIKEIRGVADKHWMAL